VKRKVHSADQLGLGFTVPEMTRVPKSSWQCPDLSTLPTRLEGSIGVDLETCDHGLKANAGPGWAWKGGGFVAGYSVCADNFRAYLPVAHAEGPNLDRTQVRRWLNHVLSDVGQPKIFANAMYDIGWASKDGVTVHGPVVDVQLTEAILDEHRMSYSLESIAQDRLGRGKEESLLREAAAAYGVDPKSDLWMLPPQFVGPYAELDSSLPREIWEIHRPLVEAEGLGEIVKLEHDLLPMYVDMRRRGVRIDQSYAESLRDQLRADIEAITEEIHRRTGIKVSIWAAESIAKAFDQEGLGHLYGRTLKTDAPSITKDLLASIDHWLPKLILDARQKDKLAGTFLEGQVLGQLHDGRVHGQVHPLKSDDGGTVTGRISMSDPNLQFIPARSDDGKKIRGCFLPEEGEEWGTLDFNQQEPRLTVHFAHLADVAGAADARDRYLQDPNMNYHRFVADLTGLEYKVSKILNLAIIYGRGVNDTAADLGKTWEETRALFDKHHDEMPFARNLSELCQRAVNQRGYVKSILGRRMRFPLWEPARWEDRTKEMYPLEKAQKRWPNQRLVRARIHKALNSVIQPSAADQTKAAMLAVHQAGYGSRVMIQVHDELDCSIPDRRTGEEIGKIMEDAVRLEVPTKVDLEVGPNWADAK